MGAGERGRRNTGYWAPFNIWWRSHLEKYGERPKAEDLKKWFNEEAKHAFPSEPPTYTMIRNHAKGLRDIASVKHYFRDYRARKRRAVADLAGETSPRSEPEDEEDEESGGGGSGPGVRGGNPSGTDSGTTSDEEWRAEMKRRAAGGERQRKRPLLKHARPEASSQQQTQFPLLASRHPQRQLQHQQLGQQKGMRNPDAWSFGEPAVEDSGDTTVTVTLATKALRCGGHPGPSGCGGHPGPSPPQAAADPAARSTPTQKLPQPQHRDLPQVRVHMAEDAVGPAGPLCPAATAVTPKSVAVQLDGSSPGSGPGCWSGPWALSSWHSVAGASPEEAGIPEHGGVGHSSPAHRGCTAGPKHEARESRFCAEEQRQRQQQRTSTPGGGEERDSMQEGCFTCAPLPRPPQEAVLPPPALQGGGPAADTWAAASSLVAQHAATGAHQHQHVNPHHVAPTPHLSPVSSQPVAPAECPVSTASTEAAQLRAAGRLAEGAGDAAAAITRKVMVTGDGSAVAVDAAAAPMPSAGCPQGEQELYVGLYGGPGGHLEGFDSLPHSLQPPVSRTPSAAGAGPQVWTPFAIPVPVAGVSESLGPGGVCESRPSMSLELASSSHQPMGLEKGSSVSALLGGARPGLGEARLSSAPVSAAQAQGAVAGGSSDGGLPRSTWLSRARHLHELEGPAPMTSGGGWNGSMPLPSHGGVELDPSPYAPTSPGADASPMGRQISLPNMPYRDGSGGFPFTSGVPVDQSPPLLPPAPLLIAAGPPPITTGFAPSKAASRPSAAPAVSTTTATTTTTSTAVAPGVISTSLPSSSAAVHPLATSGHVVLTGATHHVSPPALSAPPTQLGLEAPLPVAGPVAAMPGQDPGPGCTTPRSCVTGAVSTGIGSPRGAPGLSVSSGWPGAEPVGAPAPLWSPTQVRTKVPAASPPRSHPPPQFAPPLSPPAFSPLPSPPPPPPVAGSTVAVAAGAVSPSHAPSAAASGMLGAPSASSARARWLAYPPPMHPRMPPPPHVWHPYGYLAAPGYPGPNGRVPPYPGQYVPYLVRRRYLSGPSGAGLAAAAPAQLQQSPTPQQQLQQQHQAPQEKQQQQQQQHFHHRQQQRHITQQVGRSPGGRLAAPRPAAPHPLPATWSGGRAPMAHPGRGPQALEAPGQDSWGGLGVEECTAPGFTAAGAPSAPVACYPGPFPARAMGYQSAVLNDDYVPGRLAVPYGCYTGEADKDPGEVGAVGGLEALAGCGQEVLQSVRMVMGPPAGSGVQLLQQQQPVPEDYILDDSLWPFCSDQDSIGGFFGSTDLAGATDPAPAAVSAACTSSDQPLAEQQGPLSRGTYDALTPLQCGTTGFQGLF